MRSIFVTVGLPRSGKSTWAKESGMPIVNRDAIRIALHGEAFILAAEDMVTSIETYMAKSLLLSGHQDIVIDSCNVTQAYRDRWRKFGKAMAADVKIVLFKATAEECKERARLTNKEDLLAVIDGMSNKWQWPDKDSTHEGAIWHSTV